MAIKPKRPCSHIGCKTITSNRYCDDHEMQHRHDKDKQRPSAHDRGYTKRWAKESKLFLANNPLCCHCQRDGLIRSAEVTDHITPHKGNQDLFWDQVNWQPLCKRHHDIKTAKEDGGFGR